MDFSLQILGGSWRIFPGGTIVGPPDKSAEIFLPSLSHPQVQLPCLVHGPGRVEWERRHLQQCEYEGQRVSRLFKTHPLKILFPLFQQHHKEIEDQAEMAKKTVMEKLGLCFKKGDKDKGEKVTKSLFKKMESTDKKES